MFAKCTQTAWVWGWSNGPNKFCVRWRRVPQKGGGCVAICRAGVLTRTLEGTPWVGRASRFGATPAMDFEKVGFFVRRAFDSPAAFRSARQVSHLLPLHRFRRFLRAKPQQKIAGEGILPLVIPQLLSEGSLEPMFIFVSKVWTTRRVGIPCVHRST